jgi:hypothetical protein
MCLGMKTKMIISDFQELFSSIFHFLGLNGNGSGNRNTKMITVKIIRNESENFQRLPYLADNLLSAVIDSNALNPNLFIDYTNIYFRSSWPTSKQAHPHTQAY